MLPAELPVITRLPVVLRPFRFEDAALVQSVAIDPLIPLITTVPASGDLAGALAYIERQHDRFASGEGYSFAIADAATSGAVGQIGLWLSNYSEGRACCAAGSLSGTSAVTCTCTACCRKISRPTADVTRNRSMRRLWGAGAS
jgi:hypothetical protein